MKKLWKRGMVNFMETDEYGNPKVYKKKVRRLIKGAIVYDLETDSKDPAVANLKWFGAYSYEDDQYYTYTYKQKDEIQELMERHKVIIGFNNKYFDDPILAREIPEMNLKYKSVIDLYEVSKKRLGNMGVKPVNFKLKTIVELLKLDKEGKGEMDYTILQKDEWSNEEIKIIKEYLNQDIIITKKLFDWFKEQFAPLKQYMSDKDNKKYIYVSCSTASLAYRTICNMCDLDAEFKSDEVEEDKEEEEEMDEEPKKKERIKISGGHHVWPRDDRARGHIISVDFACLLEGEKVYTESGYKNVEDLTDKDVSLSYDLKPNKINKIQKEKADEIVIITLSNGDVLKITPNHKMPVFIGKKNNTTTDIKSYSLLEANSLKSGYNIISPVKEHKIEEGDDEDIFELLGIFLCEGRQDQIKRFLKDKRHPRGRNSTASRTEITIKEFELDFKIDIDRLCVKHVPYKLKWIIKHKTSKGRSYCSLGIKDTRKEVFECFKNIVDSKFNIKEITKTKSRIKSFLSGILKSDGTFNTFRKELVLQNHDEKLMMIVRRCLDLLGIYYNSYISKKPEGTSVKHTNSISITYGSELNKIFSWFKFNSYRDGRVDLSKSTEYTSNFKFTKIVNIEKIKGDFNVYNISMQRQNSPFYIHNGHFTKNSAYPHSIIMGNLLSPKKGGWSGESMTDGKPYYQIGGEYKKDVMGDKEKSLRTIYLERVKAKKAGDKIKTMSYKIVINCFSENTEVLTPNGIKLLVDCNVGDMVYSINQETEEVEIKPIIKMYEQEYKGNMIHFKDKNVDLVVTPNHDMLVKSYLSSNINKIQAQYVIEGYVPSVNGHHDYSKMVKTIIQNPTNKIVCCSVADNATLMAGCNGKLQWTGNSFYGTLGNNVFSQSYDPVAAGDCTSIVRNWMKRLAYKLEMNGYRALYGFTDSVMCLLPPNRTKADLMRVVNEYVTGVNKSLPFPQDTFNLEIDKEMKFVWVVTMNNYLWVNLDDTIGYRSTLFNKNTPPIIMDMFNDYMAPKIIKMLDVDFNEQELKDKLREVLEGNLAKAGQEYNVNDYKKYKSETSMQYNISKKYGEGKHFLIPNLMDIGIGKAKGKKGKFGRRYCTIKEFEDNNLSIDDIDLERLMRYVSDFYSKSKNKKLDKEQTKLSL